MRIFIVAALAALVGQTAQAGSICNRFEADTAFHCKIKGSSREVTVCDLPNGNFLYVYGKPGRPPELELDRRKDALVYTPWNGVGSSIWARLGFRNKGYLYDVGWSIDRGPESKEPAFGWLDIYEPGTSPESGNPVASKECQPGTVEGGLDGLWERFQ